MAAEMMHRQEFKMIVKTMAPGEAQADAVWFQNSINVWLQFGWRLHGSLLVTANSANGTGLVMSQALVREIGKQ